MSFIPVFYSESLYTFSYSLDMKEFCLYFETNCGDAVTGKDLFRCDHVEFYFIDYQVFRICSVKFFD